MERMLKRLCQANFHAWQMIMSRLDVKSIGNSVQASKAAADKKHDVDMTEVYLPPFLEELAIYDLSKLVTLANTIELSKDSLADLRNDFTKPQR
jgi:hypothetical protein